MVSPVLVALDFSELDRALSVARQVAPHVGGFKVGLELLMSEGPQAVSRVAEMGLPVFADGKLHDIPNTVAGAARALGRHGARWVTVHPGGRAMIEAGVKALAESTAGEGGILVVTVLTSLAPGDLAEIGVDHSIREQVAAMARLAAAAGAEGVVCAPSEAAVVRTTAPDLTIVTPGVRPAGAPSDDQQRHSTPAAARAAGADWLVIGRPITAAPDPAEAARLISTDLAL